MTPARESIGEAELVGAGFMAGFDRSSAFHSPRFDKRTELLQADACRLVAEVHMLSQQSAALARRNVEGGGGPVDADTGDRVDPAGDLIPGALSEYRGGGFDNFIRFKGHRVCWDGVGALVRELVG